MAIGTVQLTGESCDALTSRIIEHERRHRRQWGVFGLLFPPLYGAGEQLGQLAGLGDGGSGSVLEIAAGLRAGGYDAVDGADLTEASRGGQSRLVRWPAPRETLSATMYWCSGSSGDCDCVIGDCRGTYARERPPIEFVWDRRAIDDHQHTARHRRRTARAGRLYRGQSADGYSARSAV